MRRYSGRAGGRHRRRFLARALGLAALFDVYAGAVVAQRPPAAAAGPEIEAVTFIGAASLDPAILRSAILTQPSTCRNVLVALPCLIGDFDWAELRRFLPDTVQVSQDARRLELTYEAWGYPDVSVTGSVLTQDDGDVRVDFRIREGEPLRVRSIEVRGLESFSPPIVLPSPLPLAAGEPYALPRLEAAERVIRERLAERGHPHARIAVSGTVDEGERMATVVLEVAPGAAARFGPVTVAAEPPIAEAVVLRRLAYGPGDPYRPSSLERSERGLYDLPVVERASIAAGGLLRGDSVIPTHVSVDARPLHGLQSEGTLSSTRCLELAGAWLHRYFLGGGRLLAVGAGVSNLFAAQSGGDFPCGGTGDGEFADLDYEVQAQLWQPSFLGDARNTLMWSGWFRRASAPNTYIERGWGGRIAASRDLGGGLDARLAWSPERNELDASAIYFCGNYGECTPEGTARLAGPRWLAPLELVALWSSDDGPIDVRRPPARAGVPWQPQSVPDWRSRFRVALEAAGGATGSSYGFVRGLAEATGTRTLGRSGELAGRVRLGAVGGDDLLPPQLRLYSGGAGSVRGVEQNLVGPKVLVAAVDSLPGALCPPADRVCDGVDAIDPDVVTVRPTGGDRVIEGNLEGRLWLTDAFQLAAFLDYGRVWRTNGSGAALGPRSEARLTPGIGIRVIADIGPIRVDLGYDPGGARAYPVLAADAHGGVTHVGNARFDPYGRGAPGFWRELGRRLQLHMSIGQAF